MLPHKMHNKFPQTRYQGSKYKLIPWLNEHLSGLSFNTALDAFSGTNSVSYLLKELGKEVHTNDIMKCNYITGKALIENNSTTLNEEDLSFILTKHQQLPYTNFIEETFQNIYYTDEENKWLDVVVQNIFRLENEYKQALALWSLFQACIIKRPYNLFHRKNLHIRQAEVKRSFGNKSTWDKPFEHFFRKFINEANQAIFNNYKKHIATNQDIASIKKTYDLVYLDPPYIPQKGSLTLYQDFYHFLNGLSDYSNWKNKIDYQSKHRKLKSEYSIWEDKKEIHNGFKKVLKQFEQSIIVISYRQDGIPSINELKTYLESLNKHVEIKTIDYRYALSNTASKEVLIIAN